MTQTMVILMVAAMLLLTVQAANAESVDPARSAVAAAAKELGIRIPESPRPEEPASGFRIISATQDYARPTPDLCCHTLTPLCIGKQTFRKGIGAHANGRIVIELAQPFRTFHAFVGVDNNWDTQDSRGSVEFIVKVDGKERYHSPVCRGGGEPLSVDVDLKDARQLELVITDAGDGYSYDQADWADAVLTAAGGAQHYVGDALPQSVDCPFFPTPPTRFRYGGQDCWDVFGKWQQEEQPPQPVPGGIRYRRTWRDPETGFEATLTATLFADPPAMEIGWQFANRGNEPSALITDLSSVDLSAPSAEGRSILTSSSGGLTGNFHRATEPVGFALTSTPLGKKTLTVHGGRSSDGDLPFFLLKEGTSGWGIAVGLGWSGQWRADAAFDAEKHEVELAARMEPVHFRLAAGQVVQMPTALLIPFRGADSTGANRLRRILREHYQALLGGRPVEPPVSFNSWFVFNNGVNEALLDELADKAAPLGIEYFCLDAGWFDGDFPHGVGNWTVNAAKFPHGLKAVADHVHRLGMKFGLWFEPERVAAGTRWMKEHPELVVGDLLDLSRPEARRLVLDMMDRIITDVGVDWIRYDFNTSPFAAWGKVEDEVHQGLRQVQYIDGLYAMLDELMRRHPDLLIEQCSGGGRRIDLETIRRGHTFWKSDNTSDQYLMRFHETGGNLFLPGGLLNTNLLRYRSAGETKALFAGPLGFGLDLRRLTPEQSTELRGIIAAYKQVRDYIDQDYYPLFPQDATGQTWNGWQFLDPRTQAGFFIVYRQAESPYASAQIRLQGLDGTAAYQLDELFTHATRTASGAELADGWTLELQPDAAEVWRIKRK